MLVECKAVNDFWVKAISWWNNQSGDYHMVDVLSILYGYYPAEKRNIFLVQNVLLGW